MYSALCPVCSTALYATSGGILLVFCSTCQWTGRVAFHYLPPGAFAGAGMLSGISFAPLASMTAATTPPDPTDAPTPDPLEMRCAALISEVSALVGEVYDALRCLSRAEWEMEQWRRYEALQAAHAALYTALGEARMGAYRPDVEAVKAALRETLRWMLLLLDGAEQPAVKK